MLKIAIISVNYNRLPSLKRQLISLEKAFYPENVALIISIDKSNTDEVERFANEYIWKFGEKRVVKHKENLGLRNHMLSLGKYFDEFDALIVLEDDITVAQSYYLYAKSCVEKYHDNDDIAGISLYSYNNTFNQIPFIPIKNKYDTYFLQQASSWGEVWIKKQWLEFYKWYLQHQKLENLHVNIPSMIFHWNEKSWLKYHIAYCIDQGKYFVYPYVSLSTNNGDVGEHTCRSLYSDCGQVPMQFGRKNTFLLPNLIDGIKYDSFFENEDIFSYLKYDKELLTIDLNQMHSSKFINTPFLLTTKVINKKIVKTYGIKHKPIEMNILLCENGTGIYLYDMNYNKKNKNGNMCLINYYFPFCTIVIKRFLNCKNIINIIKSKFGSNVSNL